MSKNYTTYIESELGENNFRNIAKLLHQFGKYKGYPIQKIERELEKWVKDLRALGHNDLTIAQMISEEWLKKES